MPRPYLGVDPGLVKDPKTRAIIDEMDRALRDMTRASPTATGTNLGASSPNDLTYLTVSAEAGLINSRRITVTSPLVGTDGGAGSTFNLSLSATALGGTPALVFGTTNVEGTAATFITTDSTIAIFDDSGVPADLAGTAADGSNLFASRNDHVHKFPTTLQSAANSKTLILTDDGSGMKLSWNLGILKFDDPAEAGVWFERRIGVGTAPLSNVGIVQQETLEQTSGFAYGLRFDAQSNDSSNLGTATIIGCAGTATHTSGRSALTRFIGTDTTVKINGTGYAPSDGNRGFRSVLEFDGDDSSTIIPYHRHFSNDVNIDTGFAVITDHVAFYADDLLQGTNRWALFAVANNSYLGPDNVGAIFGTGEDAKISWNGADLVIDPTLISAGDVLIPADNAALALGAGTGGDARIYYDGTDLNIDPKAVGTGTLNIAGGTEITRSTGPVLLLTQGSTGGTTDVQLRFADMGGGPSVVAAGDMWRDGSVTSIGGPFLMRGGMLSNVTAITNALSPYTVTNVDHVILCDCSSGAITVDLLAAAAPETARILHIKKTDSSGNAVTVDGNGSETIDLELTAEIVGQHDSLMIQSDGSNYNII